MKKNILVVTGGAGFIGSNLISVILNKTNFKIKDRLHRLPGFPGCAARKQPGRPGNALFCYVKVIVSRGILITHFSRPQRTG